MVINALAALDLEPDELLTRLNDTANRLARSARRCRRGTRCTGTR